MLTENASKIQQKYLGAKGLIVLIAVMNMFVPLSETDRNTEVDVSDYT